jgi:hypothetical protein
MESAGRAMHPPAVTGRPVDLVCGQQLQPRLSPTSRKLELSRPNLRILEKWAKSGRSTAVTNDPIVVTNDAKRRNKISALKRAG